MPKSKIMQQAESMRMTQGINSSRTSMMPHHEYMADTHKSKCNSNDILKAIKFLEEDSEDERKDNQKYDKQANILESLGFKELADQLKSISKQENNHWNTVIEIRAYLRAKGMQMCVKEHIQ